MKRISFFALGLLTTASLFCAEDPSETTLSNPLRVTPPDIEVINRLADAIHKSRNNPLEQESHIKALMDQPIAQITVMGLAHALHNMDAEAGQSLRALMTEVQQKQAFCFLYNEAQEAALQISWGSRTSSAFEQSVNMMCNVYLDFRNRRIGGGTVDKKTGRYKPKWPVSCNDWADIVDLCSAIALSDPRPNPLRVDLARGLVHNQMAQFITYNLALGTAHKNTAMAEMLFDLLPRAEKIKRAQLATDIAHAYAAYGHYDQFHVWTQAAITKAPSWRSMLDMIKHRTPAKVTENELTDLSTISESMSTTSDVRAAEKPEPNRYAVLYWHARAAQVGWVDAQKQADLDVLYADIDHAEDERRAQQQKKETPTREEDLIAKVLADIQLQQSGQVLQEADIYDFSKPQSSFKNEIKAILDNEKRDDYNPKILEARLDEGDDVWRKLKI